MSRFAWNKKKALLHEKIEQKFCYNEMCLIWSWINHLLTISAACSTSSSGSKTGFVAKISATVATIFCTWLRSYNRRQWGQQHLLKLLVCNLSQTFAYQCTWLNLHPSGLVFSPRVCLENRCSSVFEKSANGWPTHHTGLHKPKTFKEIPQPLIGNVSSLADTGWLSIDNDQFLQSCDRDSPN